MGSRSKNIFYRLPLPAMLSGRREKFLVFTAVFVVATITAFPVITGPEMAARITLSASNNSFFDLTAGYADEIVFKIIEDEEQQIQALQSGEIDLIGQFVNSSLVPEINANPMIEINLTNRRGFGHVSFNCAAAPTNWTVLRRAFAHALDKETICQQGFENYARPVDSPIVPGLGAWSLDNHPDFIKNYYEPDIATGNALLDAAGFIDTDDDGWREDPNGNPINISVMGDETSNIIETIVIQAVSAFTSLHVISYMDFIDFNTLLARVDMGNYNAAAWAFNLGGKNPLFLENFQSGDIGNDWRFSNSTYDALVDIMLESIDKEEVYEACWEAQRILWLEQPLCVAYQNLLISAYRKDPWTGYVNVESEGTFETWSLLNVRLKEEFGSGPDYDLYKQGGRFTLAMSDDMESTNILNSNSAYTFMPLNLVYDKLIKHDPVTQEIVPWIAQDWFIEEVNPLDVSATPRAQEGDLLKITFLIRDNFTWHDGEPLTAHDVKFTNEMKENETNPVYIGIVYPITHIEAPNNMTAEIFLNIVGYHAIREAEFPILPKHIWETVESPLTWSNPSPLGSGPYKWKSRTPGVEVVLERNDNFTYNPRNYLSEESTTTTTDYTTVSSVTTSPETTTVSDTHFSSSETTTTEKIEELEEFLSGGITLLLWGAGLAAVVIAGFAIGAFLGKKISRFN